MPFRFLVPILAGATLHERILACIGALIAILLTGAICMVAAGAGLGSPFIVAPIGASAVLLFAVPASPLAQPWSIIGGNTISAIVGVIVARFVADPVLAGGLSVSVAIAAMSVTRCLHPPGGAAALTAVLSGPVVAGSLFPFFPVALNSILLVAVGMAFHRLSRRSYPHRPAPPLNGLREPLPRLIGLESSDVDAALAALDETFDIDRGDLERLLREVELQALKRTRSTKR